MSKRRNYAAGFSKNEKLILQTFCKTKVRMPVIKEEKAQPELILTLAQHNTRIKQRYYYPDCYKDRVKNDKRITITISVQNCTNIRA